MGTEGRAQDREAAAEDAGDEAPRPASFLAGLLATLARLPKAKLLVLATLALVIVLAIAGVVALVASLVRKPAAPMPAPPAAPVAAEKPVRPSGKASVEERFEAIKRGDLSGIPRRHTVPAQPAVAADEKNADPVVPLPAAPPAAEAKPAAETTSAAPAAAAPADAKPATTAKASPLSKQGGCDVGTSDAKGSAASILDCIRFFNQIEETSGQKAKPKK